MSTKSTAWSLLLCMALSLGGLIGHAGTGGTADGVWVVPVALGGLLGGICLFLLIVDALSGTMRQ